MKFSTTSKEFQVVSSDEFFMELPDNAELIETKTISGCVASIWLIDDLKLIAIESGSEQVIVRII